jgi:PIN domain nuclease of toxin-antitoxin system
MKLLLDTHLLLWAAAGGSSPKSKGRLSSEAAKLIDDPANELFFSAASTWEVTVKNDLGRTDFRVNPHLFRRGLLDNGYVELPITSAHTVAVDRLTDHHKDPFDRILVAQAMVEGITLLTSDPLVAAYPGPIQLI